MKWLRRLLSKRSKIKSGVWTIYHQKVIKQMFERKAAKIREMFALGRIQQSIKSNKKFIFNYLWIHQQLRGRSVVRLMVHGAVKGRMPTILSNCFPYCLAVDQGVRRWWSLTTINKERNVFKQQQATKNQSVLRCRYK